MDQNSSQTKKSNEQLIDFNFLDNVVNILIKNESKSIKFYLKWYKFNQKMDQNTVNVIENGSQSSRFNQKIN